MQNVEPVVTAAEVTAIHSRLREGALREAAAPLENVGGWSYQVYDWSRPVKLKSDQLRTLTSIHDSFGRLLGSSLGGYLRTPADCQLVEGGVVPMPYAQYQEQSPEGNLYHIVFAPPMPVPIVIELEVGIALSILELLLGGLGHALPRPHEITEMDQVLLQERALTHVLEALREAWSNIVELSPAFDRLETNMSYVPIALPSDVVVLVTAALKVGDAAGQLRVCLPYAALEPVKDRLSAQRLLARGEYSEEVAAEVRHQVENVPLTLVAQLGEALVTLDELLELQVGDVVPLDTPVDGEIDLLIGGICRYKARPGLFRNHNAVQITRISEELEAQSGDGE